MSFLTRALHGLSVVVGASSLVSVCIAQSIVVTEHRGQPYPVMGAKGMRPYIEIDGKRIGGGQPGPVTRKLREIVLAEAMG